MATHVLARGGVVLGGGSAACRTLGGLTKGQQEVCRRFPQVTLVGVQGLQAAVHECQHQFRWHRWNCSNLSTKNRNPHTSLYLRSGYRESGFAAALASAAVAQSVAKACSQGRLLECGCEPHRRRPGPSSSWKWGGCSHNLQFGLEFSKLFLDVREKDNQDIQSRVNIHNNNAGRLALANNMEIRCKCHGVSGSCELKTCWRSAPELRRVGVALKEKYRSALMVEESNTGRGGLAVVQRAASPPHRRRNRNKRNRRRPPHPNAILYYQKSPDYCEPDPLREVQGTVGRQCRRSGRGMDSCSSLCCGRGYNVVRRRRTDKCNCKFHWCCTVTCHNCTTDEWITVCK